MSDSLLPPRPLSVFVVEDHADTLHFLKAYLVSQGYKVTCATSFEGALDGIPAAGCDILMSDVGLPDGNGWDILPRLRQSGATLPRYAIAMTGFGMTADCTLSEEVGFNRHLLKPFRFDDLDEVLAEASQQLGYHGNS